MSNSRRRPSVFNSILTEFMLEHTYDRTARKLAKRENRVAIELDVSVIAYARTWPTTPMCVCVLFSVLGSR